MNMPAVQRHRVAITGASGFIGHHLLKQLLAYPEWAIIPIARSVGQSSTGDASLEWRRADLTLAPQVESALHQASHVVHLAHGAHGPEMTRQVVNRAIANQVQRFVHISTMSVHGPAPDESCAREDTAKLGRYGNDYCDSKAEQEEIVRAAVDRGDLQGVILRPTVVYGPGSHFVNLVVQEARERKLIEFDGGTGICNALHVQDLCEAIRLALRCDAAVGQAMFINGDEPVTWGAFIRAFADCVESGLPISNMAADEARSYWKAHDSSVNHSLSSRVLSKLKSLVGVHPAKAPWPPLGRVEREMVNIHFRNDKAKRLLNWQPQLSFESGVSQTRKWLQSQV